MSVPQEKFDEIQENSDLSIVEIKEDISEMEILRQEFKEANKRIMYNLDQILIRLKRIERRFD